MPNSPGFVLGPSGNLVLTGTSTATLDLATSLDIAGIITAGTTGENKIVLSPGATGGAAAMVQSTGAGVLSIAAPGAAALALHVGASYAPTTNAIDLLAGPASSVTGGLSVYPNAAEGTGTSLVQSADVALIATDSVIDSVGMTLGPYSSQGYGLRLDPGGNHAVGGSVNLTGTLAAGSAAQNAIVLQPGSGSVAGAIHNTGTAPFWIQNTSANGSVIARVGSTGSVSLANFAILTPVGSGATGLHIYPYAPAGSFSPMVQSGDCTMIANNQTIDAQGVFIGPYSSHGYGLRLDQGGTHTLAGVVTNVSGTLEANGSPVVTVAGLAAAIAVLMQGLPTAPSISGPTLWNNSGILNYT